MNDNGPSPFSLGSLDNTLKPLITTVKAYEEHAVEAAISGSRKEALLAMMGHPMVPSFDVARDLLDEMLQANRDFLPSFFH